MIMIFASQRMKRLLPLTHNLQSAMATWQMPGRFVEQLRKIFSEMDMLRVPEINGAMRFILSCRRRATSILQFVTI